MKFISEKFPKIRQKIHPSKMKDELAYILAGAAGGLLFLVVFVRCCRTRRRRAQLASQAAALVARSRIRLKEATAIHHGGGVGMGFSQHSGMVICCDGTEEADRRIANVLWNDPATGVMRHADAGYDIAIDCARDHGLNLPGILKN